MSTKTISISDKAYKILKSYKKGKESFSDVIIKITKKQDISKFAGIISEKEAEMLKETISELRSISKKRYGL